MITARFILDKSEIIGFDVSGHSSYADSGSDIVCAAVSSAVSLCECAITDVIGANADVLVDEPAARVSLTLCSGLSSQQLKSCREMLKALYIHLKALKEEYPENIEILEV